MNQPRVTVCVPVYNTAHYIKQCIESVFAQEFKDWVLLVSDNCSTDGTWEILQRFRHPQMRLFRQPQNLGPVANWSFLLEKAETDYVCFLGSDDYFYPNHLGNKVRLLDQFPEAPFVHGSADFVNEMGVPIRPGHVVEQSQLTEECTEGLRRLLRGNYINITTVVFRTMSLKKHGIKFETRLRLFIDWHLYVELMLYHRLIVHDRQTTLAYRIHPVSDTQRNLKSYEWAAETSENFLLAFEKHPQEWARLGFDTRAMSRQMTSKLWALAFQQWRRGNQNDARKAWQTFRRFHSPAYIVRDLLPFVWRGLNKRVLKRG